MPGKCQTLKVGDEVMVGPDMRIRVESIWPPTLWVVTPGTGELVVLEPGEPINLAGVGVEAVGAKLMLAIDAPPGMRICRLKKREEGAMSKKAHSSQLTAHSSKLKGTQSCETQ